MKHCPQCGAEYDPYVQYCFVDGAELSETPVVKPAKAASGTPVPAPSAHAPSAHASSAATGVTAQPTGSPVAATATVSGARSSTAAHRPVQEARGGVSIWAVAFAMLIVIGLFGFVGLAGALLFFGGRSGTPPPEVAETIAVPLPLPAAAPLPAAITRVRFESDPAGAAVWEEDKYLCTTPCDVEHPDYAPPNRKFTFKSDGFADAAHQLSDPAQPQRVTLTKNAPIQRPPKKPGPARDDLIITR